MGGYCYPGRTAPRRDRAPRRAEKHISERQSRECQVPHTLKALTGPTQTRPLRPTHLTAPHRPHTAPRRPPETPTAPHTSQTPAPHGSPSAPQPRAPHESRSCRSRTPHNLEPFSPTGMPQIPHSSSNPIHASWLINPTGIPQPLSAPHGSPSASQGPQSSTHLTAQKAASVPYRPHNHEPRAPRSPSRTSQPSRSSRARHGPQPLKDSTGSQPTPAPQARAPPTDQTTLSPAHFAAPETPRSVSDSTTLSARARLHRATTLTDHSAPQAASVPRSPPSRTYSTQRREPPEPTQEPSSAKAVTAAPPLNSNPLPPPHWPHPAPHDWRRPAPPRGVTGNVVPASPAAAAGKKKKIINNALAVNLI